jgi:uncharacterized protein YxjI
MNPYAPPQAVLVAPPRPPASSNDAFDRDVFLLRQKVLSIDEKYFVWSEDGRQILFVKRPRYVLRDVGALLAGLFCGFVVASTSIVIAQQLPEPLRPILAVFGILGFFGALLVVATALSAKRHVYFHLDESQREPVLSVEQDRKFAPLVATYTVKDAAGRVLAKLDKNYVFDWLRKRWRCFAPDGRLITVVREDSMVLAIGRRLLGPMLGLLRTNFVFYDGDSQRELGQFNRKFTLRDHYVLELRNDPSRALDRRVALALGVMLDTGERR